MATSDYTEARAAIFWSRVHKQENGCWIWSGYVGQWGYGLFHFDGKCEKTHRLAFKLTKGEIPEGMCVCHTCDTPACVNPEHLWLGTQADNASDRHRKGRSRCTSGDDHHYRRRPELIPRGEQCGAAKLTAEQVMEIRRRFAAGGIRKAALAREYGISRCTVGEIIARKWWKHLPDENS